MSKNPATKYFATGIAAVVLTFGAYLIGRSNTSTTTAGAANASQRLPGGTGQAPQAGQLPQDGQAPQNGQAPPGFGTPVTGATAAKLQSLVTAKYPGTVERVMKLSDGSYVVHVIGSGGERHVTVSKDFKITGAEQGGPGGPGGGRQAPQGSSGSQS
ncbi:MAG: hypothetical protein ACXVFK_13240 [Solirubrobacteraceae bacterium]